MKRNALRGWWIGIVLRSVSVVYVEVKTRADWRPLTRRMSAE